MPTQSGNPAGMEIDEHIHSMSAITADSSNARSISIQDVIMNNSTSEDTATVHEEGSCKIDSAMGTSPFKQDGADAHRTQ